MSTETITTEALTKTLAESDYRVVADYAAAVNAVAVEREAVAEAPLRTTAAYARNLMEAAQKAEMLQTLGTSIGVDERHPEAWAAATNGDDGAAHALMLEVMRAAYGR